MCKSQAEGGQRCAAHTRPAYQATSPSDPQWDTVAAEYASTPEGERHLQDQITQYTAQGNPRAVARLTSALNQGRTLREANRAAAEAIKQARTQQQGGRLDRAELAAAIEEAAAQNMDGWAVDPEDTLSSIAEPFYEAEHFHGRDAAIEALRRTWRHHRDAYLAATAAGGSIADRGRHAALLVEAERFADRLT